MSKWILAFIFSLFLSQISAADTLFNFKTPTKEANTEAASNALSADEFTKRAHAAAEENRLKLEEKTRQQLNKLPPSARDLTPPSVTQPKIMPAPAAMPSYRREPVQINDTVTPTPPTPQPQVNTETSSPEPIAPLTPPPANAPEVYTGFQGGTHSEKASEEKKSGWNIRY